ncbi:alpha/beta hydrolase [Labrys sp. KNU-23]|uniref:alpha/beta hydrolase n=1 Tax=Labrys sp. KNU-23 TaxID=2789216 RepID=UPI0011ED1F5D|nr:alpha/beta hydrolase-fold protein [Labrys sp. KNU-23]QEN85794.1 alpha/beta hydrolase [Labrys sp. KNU-23]
MNSQGLIPDTICFDLAPASQMPPYRIFLRIPKEVPPPQGWPILYFLDANAVVGTAVDTVRVQAAYPLGTGIMPGVLVGIGYPTPEAYDSVRRSWDMGPPPGQTYPPHTPGGPEVRTGGADHFLAFIEDELKPQIASRAPIDAKRQAIFGHSFGGLFVLHALFRRPDAFSTWIAASPAIWWEGAGIVDEAERFVARAEAKPPGRVLVIAGEYEQRLAPFQIGAIDAVERARGHEESRIVDNARAMAERLASVPGLAASFQLLEGENHMSVLPGAVNQAVRFAFGAP